MPFSLVPFFVILAGTLLGTKGAWSLLLYMLLGLIGLPVFAKPPFGGLNYLLQPSSGFLFGYIFAAWVIGWVAARFPKLSTGRLFFASCVGLAVLYACGLPYMYLILRFVMGKTLTLHQTLVVGFYPFILLDLSKAFAASALALVLRKRLPGYFDSSGMASERGA